MTVRVMKIDDYPQVSQLWQATAGVGLRSLDDAEEGIRRFLARNPQTCFVAEENDRIIGVILSGHDGRRGYIYHAAVNSLFRRHGIGRELVAAVVRAMQLERINKLALVTFKSNELGNRFWSSMGFSIRTDLVYRDLSLNLDNR